MSALWFLKGRHLEFYIPIDLKNSPQYYLDMTFPPAKFDVVWSKETQVIVKKKEVWRPHKHKHPQNLVNCVLSMLDFTFIKTGM